MSEVTSQAVTLDNLEHYLSLFGANDRNVPLLENELDVTLCARGTELLVCGAEANVEMAVQVLEKLQSLAERHAQIDRTTLRYAVALVKEGELDMRQSSAFAELLLKRRGRGQPLELTG